jgi:hypothetical protein
VVPKVSEAPVANPSIFVLGAIALVQHVGVIVGHELGPAKLAVVVIPFRLGKQASILTAHQYRTLKVPLLSR